MARQWQGQPMTTDGDGSWVTRWDDGFSWIADPDEDIGRASHALEIGGDLHLIEPVDAPDLDDHLSTVGDPQGVIVVMDRHTRDAEAIADRWDVPIFAPEAFDRIAANLSVPPEPLEPLLEGSSWRSIPLVDNRFWQELALWSSKRRTLLVQEVLGTLSYFCVGDEPIGMHQVSRIRPPRRALEAVRPRRLLVGHGKPIASVDLEAYRRTLRLGRRRLPRAMIGAVRGVLR